MENDKLAPPRKIKSIRQIKKKQAKVVEGPKNVLILKGNKTSANVSAFLSQLHQVQDGSTFYSKHHEFFPFDDFSGMEGLLQKTESSLFVFGSSSKKKPGRIIFGRAFDYKLLDMAELSLLDFVSMSEFDNSVPYPAHAILFFQGEEWESKAQLSHLKKILQDLFCQNRRTTQLDPRSMKLLYSFSVIADKIYLRTFSIDCSIKSIKSIHNIDSKLTLAEVGPHADFQFSRAREADSQLLKKAHEVPSVLKPTKKNISKDSLGNKKGKIFVDRQDLNQLPVRKRKELKALRRTEEMAASQPDHDE